MGKITRLMAIVWFLAACLTVAYAQEQETRVIGDCWYEVILQNQKIGYQHGMVEKTKYQGKDCYKVTNEVLMKTKGDGGVTREHKELIVCYMDLDFTPLYLIKQGQDGPQKQTTELTISGGEIIIKTTLNDNTEEKKIPFEPGIVFDVSGFLLKQKGLLKLDTSASFKTISLETKSLVTQTIKILKEEKITIMDKEVNSYFAQATNSEMPGLVAKINIGLDGMELKIILAGFVMTRTTEAQAKEFKEIGTISSYIAVDKAIPFPHRIAQLQVLLTLEGEYQDIIPNNEYQKVTRSEKRYHIVLKSMPLTLEATTKIPIQDDSLKKYLEPSLFIQSQDALIVTQAKEIIKEAKDAAQAARLITAWVFENIEKESGVTASKSAKETLASKSGDCTEHSVLFSALARAVGLPARNIDGLIFNGTQFGYHAWNEVYLGKWIPVDATVNRVGIPATYIKFGEGEPTKKEYYQESLTRLIKMFGQTTIKVISFTDRQNKVFDMSDPAQYLAQQGDTYEDQLLGITITKPKGWAFQKLPNGGFTLTARGTVVVVAPLPVELMGEQKTSKATAAEVIKGGMAEFEDVTQTPLQELKVSGHPALESIFSGKHRRYNINMKSWMIVTQSNDRGFIILFTSMQDTFDQFLDDFKKVLTSIKF